MNQKLLDELLDLVVADLESFATVGEELSHHLNEELSKEQFAQAAGALFDQKLVDCYYWDELALKYVSSDPKQLAPDKIWIEATNDTGFRLSPE